MSNENVKQLVERFKLFFNDRIDGPFFLFDPDGAEDCYFLYVDHYETYSDVLLNDYDDEEVARIDLDPSMIDVEGYLDTILNIFLLFMNMDLLAKEKTVTKNIQTNKNHLIKFKSGMF